MRERHQLKGQAFMYLCLAFVFAFCASMASAQSPIYLPNSPESTSVLVGKAIHSGEIQIPVFSETPAFLPGPPLTCSPVPCVLPNVQASGGTNIANEDPIAANPNTPALLLTGANDYSCTTTLQGFYASHDGGSTWTHTCLPAISGGSGDGDPVVGWDLAGTAFAGGIQIGPPGQIIAVASSPDNGTTWNAPVVAVKPTISGGITDKDWLQIDTTASSPHANCLYVSNTQFNSSGTQSQISVTHSCDHGATWKTVTIDPVQSSVIDQFSDLAIGKDGSVYVSWQRCPPTGPTGDCGGTVATMMISKSTDGGNTWSTPVTMVSTNLAPDTCGAYYGCLPNTSERVSNIPAIGIDNSTGKNAGHLYVVYYNWTGTQMKVLVAHSTNGTTWSSGVPVAPSTATHDQFFPWLSVAANGEVAVTWLDRRNDPANVKYDSYATGSTNGGSSFLTNLKLTSVMSNPFNDGFQGSFMGDYTGNTIARSTLYASWMDMRNGQFSQDYVGGVKVH